MSFKRIKFLDKWKHRIFKELFSNLDISKDEKEQFNVGKEKKSYDLEE